MVAGFKDRDSDFREEPARPISSRAQDYLAMAESYVVAVEGLLHEAARVFAPFHMMVGHALELSLKAVLAHTGRDEEWLMMSGHDLGHCYRQAYSNGFSGSAGEKLASLVNVLDRPHADQRFRYPVVLGGTPCLSPADAADTLRLHLEDVRAWLCSNPAR